MIHSSRGWLAAGLAARTRPAAGTLLAALRHRPARWVPVGVVAGVLLLNGSMALADARHGRPELVVRRTTVGPTTAQEECTRVVETVVNLVPDSWGYGLRGGVSERPLVDRYGANSPQVRAFRVAQAQLLADFATYGLHNTTVRQELAAVRPGIVETCAQASGSGAE